MCDSLPLDQPWPRRLGNEDLCKRCQDGDCEHCASRHGVAVWCGHFCDWIPDVPPRLPKQRKADR